MSTAREASSRLLVDSVMAAAVLLCVGSMLCFLVAKRGEYSEWNYDRIRIGMTLDEVERLLGRAGIEVPQEEVPKTPHQPAVRGHRCFLWRPPDQPVGFIAIALGEDGRVCDKFMFHSGL